MKRILLATLALGAAAVTATAKPPTPVTRLFVQDSNGCAVRWADVRESGDAKLALDPPSAIEGFKVLDPAKQKLVQMRAAHGTVCVGVRDDADGAFESGWILIRSGVKLDDHGDHAHWAYAQAPVVADSRLDKQQGNPAHLYEYGGRFFLANDKLDGYTRLDPAEFTGAAKGTPQFLAGGGSHITMAVVGDRVGYATWIDSGGPNKGRVDVTPVAPGAKPAYSFRLPSGGLHGATVNSGKLFFAPAEGVAWVEADSELKRKANEVKVHTIPLDKEGDKPTRTGAFANLGRHVLFVAGKEKPQLVVVDASRAEPMPVTLPLGVIKGTVAVTPEVVITAGGTPLALVFHDRVKDSDAQDTLEVIALDPNGDGDFSDAKSLKTLPVGKSAVEGHFGHHAVAFDANRRFGFITNSGDGTVSALSLKNLEIVATLPVGGSPAAVVAVGGEAADD